jgi:hypothetical protein
MTGPRAIVAADAGIDVAEEFCIVGRAAQAAKVGFQEGHKVRACSH